MGILYVELHLVLLEWIYIDVLFNTVYIYIYIYTLRLNKDLNIFEVTHHSKNSRIVQLSCTQYDGASYMVWNGSLTPKLEAPGDSSFLGKCWYYLGESVKSKLM